MAILTVYPDSGTGGTTVDGEVGRDVSNAVFSTIRNGSGTTVDDTGTTADAKMFINVSADFDEITQWIGTFDTSAIGTGTINSVKLSLWFTTSSDNFTATGTKELHIAGATPASDNALVIGDYGSVGRTTFADVTSAATSTGAYTEFTLNASGESNINKTGISRFSAQTWWDLNDAFDGDLAVSKLLSWTISTADGTSGQRPKLVIDYTPTEFFATFTPNMKMTSSINKETSTTLTANMIMSSVFGKSPEIKEFLVNMKLTSSISKSLVTLVEFTANIKMTPLYRMIMDGLRVGVWDKTVKTAASWTKTAKKATTWNKEEKEI